MKPGLSKIPVSSIMALIAIVFFCSCLALSIAAFPAGFNPLDNWMSDLGNPELNPAGSAYFNWACMITGLFLVVFYIGLKDWHTTGSRKTGMLNAARAFGLFSGIALAGVGYFPETFSPHHFIVSVLFFASSTIAILLATLAMRGHPDSGKVVSGAGYLTVAIGIVFSFQMALWESITIIEWISVFSMLLWAALVAQRSLRSQRK